MDTRTHTPVRPSSAERARTVLAATASASVQWDGGRVDLLGCHHDDPLGDVILTLESTSTLVRAARDAPGEDLPVVVQLTELCAVSAHERVRARLSLGGWLTAKAMRTPSERSVALRMEVGEVILEEGDARDWVDLPDYRAGVPDPLHAGAAEQLQHLAAHHQDAISVLARLCDRESMLGAVRVLPIALDRYGIELRIERVRGHRDVRLPFRTIIDSGAEAAIELRYLLTEGSRRRPCARSLYP